MRLPELDQLIVDLLVKDDHPEIVRVEMTATGDNPANHTRLVVHFASGGTTVVMRARAEGPGISRHTEYEVPREVVSA